MPEAEPAKRDESEMVRVSESERQLGREGVRTSAVSSRDVPLPAPPMPFRRRNEAPVFILGSSPLGHALS